MTTVVMFPTRMESAPFEVRVAEGACGSDVSVRICGVGMAESGAAVAQVVAELHPDLLILAGVAGSYTEVLAFGDTVVVSSECVADMGRVESWTELSGERFTPLFQKIYPLTVQPEGFAVVRSNTVNGCGIPYINTTDAEIENMEGASFACTANALGVRCMEVRTISNRVGERFGRDEVEQCAKLLADCLCKIVNDCEK